MSAQIEGMGLLAEQIADRWASGWPEQTKVLMKKNRLLDLLTDQVQMEKEMQAQACNLSHLAHHEVMELYEFKSSP